MLQIARDLATLGLAVGGLATMVTGGATLVMLAGRPSPWLVGAFGLAIGVTAISGLTIVVVGIRTRREFGDPHSNGDRG